MESRRRIGIFIDGGFHDFIYQELAATPPRRRLSMFGFVESAERYFSGQAVERHYVRGSHGRNSYRSRLMTDLTANRFDVHTTPIAHHKEVGVDVALALLVYSRTLEEQLDSVVVLTGDGDLFPLIEALKRINVPCMIPRVELAEQRTSRFLLEAAEHTPDLMDLDEEATRIPGGHALLARDTPRPRPPEANSNDHRGIIKFVDRGDRFAFIEDTDGHTWYMSPRTVPGEPREAPMEVGMGVSFSGAPRPAPGQKYPRAWSIRTVV